MKIAAIDLETIPDASMIHLLPDPEPNKTLKDPAKIAEDIAKKKEKQLDDMGMDPLMNIIVCAGIYGMDTDKGEIIETGILLDPDESIKARIDMLEAFWGAVENIDHFVTFNGRSFDIRVLGIQNMKLAIRPSIVIDSGKYNRGNHTDMRPVLAGEGQFAKGNLEFFASILLNDHKTKGIDGKLVYSYWQMGVYDKIKEYCLDDCRLTYNLFDLALKAGLVNL